MASGNDENQNEFFDDEERKHFAQVKQTFSNYGNYMKRRINKSLENYRSLSKTHKTLIPDYEENCCELIKCVDANSAVINKMLEFIDHLFVNQELSEEMKSDEEIEENLNNLDMDRVLTTFKQISRDWSDFGLDERKACYDPIIKDLKSLYPQNEFDFAQISVLVPGTGLGRLAFEIANLGFRCEGNEFSLFMLIASNFILNKCNDENEFEIYPWIQQSSNNMSFKDQISRIRFPDIAPIKVSSNNQFSMAAGDFLEIYNESESWNVIVTCYFIDTARNILNYIEKIYYLLTNGGYWINFGPLLYHFADMKNEKSIELNYEQVKYAINKIGFVYISEETRVKSTYTENKNSMLRYMYDCVHFVCQKPTK